MLPNGDLPIILVCARSKCAASKIISDIIDNEVTEVYSSQNISQHRVWRITNKYYTADVCLQPYTDDDMSLSNLDNIEALIVYLTVEECAGSEESVVEMCEARVRRAGLMGHVRLAAAECGAPLDSLATAAARLRLELVPLQVDPLSRHDAEEHDEERGLARVRAALHAHVWPGIRLAAAAPPSLFSPLTLLPYRGLSGSETSSSGDDAGDDAEDCAGGGDEESVERVEAFAEALGALPDAAQLCAALPGPERLRRAELLVAAFCRALGHQLDT